MLYNVKGFKSLRIGLKEMEPYIRLGTHLQTGKEFKSLGLRPREILANWLMCVAINSITQPDRLMFTSDPLGGDGIIHDNMTGETWATEHILVPNIGPDDGLDAEERILKAVEKKRAKGGAAYASGKTLVVFLNRDGGQWYPNKVTKRLPDPLLFDAVWVVGFQFLDAGDYVYGVTRLDMSHGNAPAWRVRVSNDFETWSVEAVQ